MHRSFRIRRSFLIPFGGNSLCIVLKNFAPELRSACSELCYFATHTITVSAVDSVTNSASDTISITITSPPGAITLQVSPNKQKGKHTPVLSWSGANGGSVDIYRDGGELKLTTTANDGSYTDATGNKGGRTYRYQVCEVDSSICSAEVTVVY
jgi:serine protease